VSKPIIVVGSLNMDLVVRAPRHPQPGETLLGSDFGTFPGGKGANQAVAAARAGGKVTMIGRVGDDAFGEALLATVQRDGVNATHIRRDPSAPTGVALITLDTAGQNTIIVASGANAHLSPEDVSAAEEAFAGAGVLLLQLESPLPTVIRAIELARKHDVRVVLNPAPARALEASLLASVEYLIPNQSELALLAGMVDRASAVQSLRDLGVPAVVVTLGEEGVLVVDELGEAFLPAHKVEVVDTTAAGDFAGAFAGPEDGA
jgi:ribokinase